MAQNRSGGRTFVNVIINVSSAIKTFFFNWPNKYDLLEEDSGMELVNTC